MSSLFCDVAIIGAGTAGLVAERSARRSGARTLLIDDRFAGGTCTTVGCMPSKLLIAAARAAHAARKATVFGVRVEAVKIDGAAVMRRVQQERDKFVRSVKDEFDALPKGVAVTAQAKFAGPGTLELSDGRTVSARAVVIAVGAEPSIPDTFSPVRDRVLTNDSFFDLVDLPASIAVIGSGPLGLEIAQALARLDVRVKVFDQGDKLSGLPEGAPSKALRQALNHEFETHLGVTLTARRSGGGVHLTWSGLSSGEDKVDYVLVAAGRPPRLKGLNLKASGAPLDEHGAPTTDPHTCQCGEAAIFIAGDAAHDRPVLHEASASGTIAGHNAARFPKVASSARFAALAITFTDPPVAMIGAPAKSNDPLGVTGAASYADQGRAKVDAEAIGALELYADAVTGRLTGAVMVGPGVDHTAHLIAWSVQQGLTATRLLEMPFYHPTIEEGLKPALLEICKAVGAEAPADRNDGFIAGG